MLDIYIKKIYSIFLILIILGCAKQQIAGMKKHSYLKSGNSISKSLKYQPVIKNSIFFHPLNFGYKNANKITILLFFIILFYYSLIYNCSNIFNDNLFLEINYNNIDLNNNLMISNNSPYENLNKKNLTFFNNSFLNLKETIEKPKDKFIYDDKEIEVIAPYPKNKILVGILSSSNPKYIYRRNDIRETWAKFEGNWNYVFILGLPFNEEHIKENNTYGDLMLVKIEDSYRKALPKKVYSLFWLGNKLNVSWIFKTDDDTFLNIPLLIKKTKTIQPPIYGGYIHHGMIPIRLKRHRWYTPRSVWPDDDKEFPDYAAGCGYLLSGDLLPCFLKEFKEITTSLEDINTGIIATYCKIKPTNLSGIHITNKDENSNRYFNLEKTLLQHYAYKRGMKALWKKFNIKSKAIINSKEN